MSIKSKIKYWYLGGPLPTRVKNSETSTTIRMSNTFEPVVSARLAQWCVKNILPILMLIAVISVPLYIYLDSKPSSQPHQKTEPAKDNEIVNNHNKSPQIVTEKQNGFIK